LEKGTYSRDDLLRAVKEMVEVGMRTRTSEGAVKISS
jgi:hypothetical protein